jgi:hypothetical protein
VVPGGEDELLVGGDLDALARRRELKVLDELHPERRRWEAGG